MMTAKACLCQTVWERSVSQREGVGAGGGVGGGGGGMSRDADMESASFRRGKSPSQGF